MALVSNSSPLISLARIRKLELLPEAYSEIVIPEAVRDEVAAGVDRAGAKEIASAPWLRIADAEDQPAVEQLRSWLDPGESEAIVLAQRQDLPLAIDERRGRNIAASLGVPTTGTVGILLALKKLGLVQEISPLLDDLIRQGFRLSRRLYESVLKRASEG